MCQPLVMWGHPMPCALKQWLICLFSPPAMNVSMNTKKFVQMGQQCLERITVLLQSLPQSPGGTAGLQPLPRSPGGASVHPQTLPQSPGGTSVHPQSLPPSPGGAYMAVSPTSVSVPLSPGGSVQTFPQCPVSQSGPIRRTSTSGNIR